MWRWIRAGAGRLDPESVEARSDRRKALIRSKAEHPFLYVRRRFGYAQARCRGLQKSTRRLPVLLGMVNLMMAGRLLAAARWEKCTHQLLGGQSPSIGRERYAPVVARLNGPLRVRFADRGTSQCLLGTLPGIRVVGLYRARQFLMGVESVGL